MQLSDSNISSLIRRHFPELTEPALLQEIAHHGKIMHFSAGDILMNYGSYIKNVPLLIRGSIKVIREDEMEGRELLLYYLNSGDTCSMSFSCCMANKRSDIKTIAEEDSTIIAIPVTHIDQWISAYPSWKRFVMRSYDMRMQELVKTISMIAFAKLDERLMTYLENRSALGNNHEINATHQEIALDLNASREAISRLLKQLEKENVVKLERNKIVLL